MLLHSAHGPGLRVFGSQQAKEAMMPQHLPVEEVKGLLNTVAPRIGHIALFTYLDSPPIAAIHWEEWDETNDWQRGDAVYLVWRSRERSLKCRRVTDSDKLQAFFCLNGLRCEGEEVVITLQRSLAARHVQVDDDVLHVPLGGLEDLLWDK